MNVPTISECCYPGDLWRRAPPALGQCPRRNGMLNVAVYDRLVQTAKARKTVSYGELGKVADVSLDTDDGTKTLGLMLDVIADQEVNAGRPLLAVVVVSEKTNMPGAGLFKYAKRKRLQKGDDLTFFATELNRVYAYWAANDPPADVS